MIPGATARTEQNEQHERTERAKKPSKDGLNVDNLSLALIIIIKSMVLQ